MRSYRRCGLRRSRGNWCWGLDWRSHRWSSGNLRRRSCRFRYRCRRRCRGACRGRRYLWGGSHRWRSHRLWRRWRDRTAGYGWPHRRHDHARCWRRRDCGLRWDSYRSFCRRCCWLDFGDWRVGYRGTRRGSRGGGSFLADGFQHVARLGDMGQVYLGPDFVGFAAGGARRSGSRCL